MIYRLYLSSIAGDNLSDHQPASNNHQFDFRVFHHICIYIDMSDVSFDNAPDSFDKMQFLSLDSINQSFQFVFLFSKEF